MVLERFEGVADRLDLQAGDFGHGFGFGEAHLCCRFGLGGCAAVLVADELAFHGPAGAGLAVGFVALAFDALGLAHENSCPNLLT